MLASLTVTESGVSRARCFDWALSENASNSSSLADKGGACFDSSRILLYTDQQAGAASSALKGTSAYDPGRIELAMVTSRPNKGNGLSSVEAKMRTLLNSVG